MTADGDGVKPSAISTAQAVTKGVGAHVAKVAAEPSAPVGAPTVETDVDFGAMLAAADEALQEQPDFLPGDKVSGVVEVISLHGQEVFLDLGGKATGYILKEEVRDADENLTVAQGDVIEGIVVRTDSNGVKIARSIARASGADMRAMKDAHAAGLPVEGKVVATNKGGYEVLVAGGRGFCPFSQIDLYRPEDPESFVGQVFDFRVTELRGDSVVLSRAVLLRGEQEAKAEELRAKLSVGARMTGKVRSIQKFGAFVDLGGLDGLIHVSELSWNRVEDPHEVVQLGQDVEVVVVELDEKRGRIALSLRKAIGDPFEDALQSLRIDQMVDGTVARLTNFGAFITVAPTVDGLIHVSDLAHHRVRHPRDVLAVGDTVKVKVVEIDVERRRIGLSLKALADDPWDTADSRYAPGTVVEGTVASIQTFGVFVDLAPGVTALLPGSESGVAQGQGLHTVYKVGNKVEARVLRVDSADRKLALTVRDPSESGRRPDPGPRRDDRGGPRRGDSRGGGERSAASARSWIDTGDAKKSPDGKALGSLGELLMKALKKEDS